jgi:hypothetical protein
MATAKSHQSAFKAAASLPHEELVDLYIQVCRRTRPCLSPV